MVDLRINETLCAGTVRNAGRIWASTPQNRAYRGMVEMCIYFQVLL